MKQKRKSPEKESSPTHLSAEAEKVPQPLPPEFGGRKGPEATRYGDWEANGKCVDF
ncbi:MAG: DUF1674 domain-containing protein [Alphaproteobacteria bacterium]|nr:DUF1674 domain-containing protein [Alphaproteobacteria bacterium]